MQGHSVGVQRQWGSSSRLNELHAQSNTITSGLNTRYMEQMPLNNGMLNPANTAYSVSSQGNPAQAIHHHHHLYKLVMKVSDMIGVSGKPESSHFMSATH